MKPDQSVDAFPFPELETTRTSLRILTLDDTESIFQHFSDDDVTRMLDTESCQCLDEAREIIVFHLNDSGCSWGIFDKETNKLLGTCGYHCWYRDKSPHTAEIGYDLGKAYWGQGIMRKVLQVVVSFGFTEMSLNRIEADPSPENLRSIRLLERLGFQPDSTLRDGQQWFHVLKRDWNAGATI